MNEEFDIKPVELLDFSKGLGGLVDTLRTKYTMPEDSIILVLLAISVSDEEFDKNFILQNVISRNNFFDLRSKVRELFLTENPAISLKEIDDFIRMSKAPIKDFILKAA